MDKLKKECCFCDEFQGGGFPEKYLKHYPVKSRVCLESENFIVVPSISPIVVGHFLVLPKKHISNLFSIKKSEWDEFLRIVGFVIDRLKSLFGEYFIFEHGVGNDYFEGCGVDHAHLHIMPIPKKYHDDIISAVSICSDKVVIDSVSSIYNAKNDCSSYLLFGYELSKMNYLAEDKMTSQFIRRVVSCKLGVDSYDWKECKNKELFFKTLDIFL